MVRRWHTSPEAFFGVIEENHLADCLNVDSSIHSSASIFLFNFSPIGDYLIPLLRVPPSNSARNNEEATIEEAELQNGLWP